MIQNNRADFQQKFSRYAERHKYIYCIHTYKYTYIPINLKKSKQLPKCNVDMAQILEVSDRELKIRVINMLRALMKKLDNILKT